MPRNLNERMEEEDKKVKVTGKESLKRKSRKDCRKQI